MDILKFILILLCAYLIGSIPFGYLAGKLIKRVDLRQEGSKNVGATNVFRVIGTVPAIAVLLLDISKGFLSIHLPNLFNLGGSLGISPQAFTLVRILAGLAAIAGHNWTIFLKFRGGKGVATACGVSLGLAPFPTLVSLAIFMVVTGLTHYVSLGSMFAVLAFPLNCLLFKESLILVFFGSIVALLIIFMHKANIKRLITGTENRIEWVRNKERIPNF
jgi:glycerol-3-phosphate acyltransferase PlsY